MWLKLCLLLLYIFLLFIISRMLDAIYWCEIGYGASFSRQLLDPMVLSVSKLKALLEQRGVSYEGVIEKSELGRLVDSTGEVTAEEAEIALEENDQSADTNFTSGAHFIEQVEDAKDSVWLVQILSYSGHQRILSYDRWKAIRGKVSRFGVRTGILDCSLDYKYCYSKGWKSPFLLLALPSQFEKKANVAMYNYSGSVKETAVLHWVHEKLNEKVSQIENPLEYHQEWKSFSKNQIESEIRAVLFTKHQNIPMFFSALSVKFPGRVKFGVVFMDSSNKIQQWKDVLSEDHILTFPAYKIYSQENVYVYGNQPNERYSFESMEIVLKFLYPCLNDIFILSFCMANIMSWFELFISNCGAFKRVRKLLWCMVKYNIIVIMLWLPIIGIFQMPFLDRMPQLALKVFRIFCMSWMGTILRSDYIFLVNNPIYIYSFFLIYSVIITLVCKKYRREEQEEDWFNFAQMRTLTYLRPNDFFEPMRIGGSDFLGGLEIFGSQLSQPSLWLQPSVSPEYIKYLPTWPFSPKPISEQLQENIGKIEQAMNEITLSSSSMDFAACSTISAHSSTVSLHCQCQKNKHSSMKNSSFLCDNGHQPENLCMKGLQTVNSPNSSESYSSLQSIPIPQTDQRPEERSKVFVACSCAVTSLAESLSSPSPSHCLDNKTTDSAVLALNQWSQTSEANVSTSSPCNSGFPAGYLETYQCVICLDDFAPQISLCGLPCGHVFHETCIIRWLNRDKHFCPMCRWPSYKVAQNTAQNQS
ncbi:dual oxidase 1 [Biomphalaria glabrata]